MNRKSTIDGPAWALSSEARLTSSDSLPIIRLDDVSVRYGGVQALAGVSLECHPGEVLGIIGPNGAGKTTLFDAICGTTAATGSVAVEGVEVSGKSALRRARAGIRRTFQRQQVFDGLTVEENVLAGLEWQGGTGGVAFDLLGLKLRRRMHLERIDRVNAVIELCRLEQYRHTLAGHLPIGVLRLLELARAIVSDPKLLLLDEPTSGLEEPEMDVLASVIERIKRQGASAAILIEHDVQFVMKHSDRVLALKLGTVLAEGLPHEIQSNAEVRAAYFGAS